MRVSRFLQRLQQRGDGVIRVVQFVAEQQHPALLGGEQEDQAHHDRKRRLVQFALVDVMQQGAPVVLVQAVQRAHEHIYGAPHLFAKLVGDFLLLLRAFRQHAIERLVLRHVEETRHAQ